MNLYLNLNTAACTTSGRHFPDLVRIMCINMEQVHQPVTSVLTWPTVGPQDQ